ncbi:hypothetical protein IFO70_18955 [Phormidium tenue FACHB-886]|nr:hypothetical protein [Phormidium tenue FACHB-886]
MSVDLKEFPQRIASVRSQLLIQQQNHRRLSDILNSLDRDIDLTMASSSELKNEQQRKAAKAELQTDEKYQAALMEVRKWFFVPWQLIRERFDEVYPGWEVYYSTPVYLGDSCVITCTITIAGISKQGVGNAEIQLLSSSGKNMARGTTVERSTADAFKDAAEAWGVARYLDEQTDPKTKADFVRYMQGKGDERAAAYYHQNNGSTAKSTSPAPKQTKPFGQSAQPKKIAQQPTNVVPLTKPAAEPAVISPEQCKRFWAIACSHNWSDEAVKLLVSAWGFASSKLITTNAYEGLCAKLEDPKMLAVYNDRAVKEAAAMVEPEF